MGCSYFWWGYVELCFVSADERPRTVCGFALPVWLVWLSWLGTRSCESCVTCFAFVSFLAGGLRPIPGVTHSREGSRARLLVARSRERSLSGRCRGCGWCGRVGGGGPARVGVFGRTLRREIAQEEPVDAAAARRQKLANQWVSSRGREGRA
eukprot:260228-Prymnesium_polylepis.1